MMGIARHLLVGLVTALILIAVAGAIAVDVAVRIEGLRAAGPPLPPAEDNSSGCITMPDGLIVCDARPNNSKNQ